MVGYEENLESSNLILRPFPWFRWFNFLCEIDLQRVIYLFIAFFSTEWLEEMDEDERMEFEGNTATITYYLRW